jgi:hypothetical protein
MAQSSALDALSQRAKPFIISQIETYTKLKPDIFLRNLKMLDGVTPTWKY